ncbi:MAG: glycoside hydrolase family 2 TIM barrel-domain containing protein [Fermentimonas sp.]|nr:glycoside hydrolase family 2 TIM barrel-domain containing protein [Fermentimonas sp.]
MNKFIILYLTAFSLIFVSCKEAKPRSVSSFNEGWTFQQADFTEASSIDFNDDEWRKLDLPHDWSIEGEFSEDHPAGSGGGALPGGIGWYRKTFHIDRKLEDKKVFIDFDGVYMNSEVWINGHYLGKRPFGYISFRYDLTPYLYFGKENTIAVRVDNSLQPNSRWYSGSGIYRNVWLTVVNPLYVDLWGTFVTTPEVNEESAIVNVDTRLKNETGEDILFKLRTTVIDDAGKIIASTESEEQIKAGLTGDVSQNLNLNNPESWTIDRPYLYSVESEVVVNGKIIDNYTTPLGVRSFSFDPVKGFFLNGEATKIKGVCMHHDLGYLGAAVNKRAIERQLEILKEMGVNGIRTAHNPPAPELLELCDKMGFIVMNETFDIWRKKMTEYDYSLHFNEWHERDLTDHILRDRNHPSVFMWSIANEVMEQWTHAEMDTIDLKMANILLNLQRNDMDQSALDEGLSVNSMLTQKLTGIVKSLDPTRPVTAGNNETNPWNHLLLADTLDIIGINYHLEDFDSVKARYTEKPFIATETTSALATRGYYRMPSDSAYIWPVRWDIPFYDSTLSCSSYDNSHVPWGSTHEETWRKVKNNDYVSGMYIWTGFDYLGEPTPFWFPARSSYFGIVDLAGFPKDAYYFYKSEWTDETMLHVFPHWNWEPGQDIDIWAYYNNADEAELFLNDVSQGIRSKNDNSFHVSWRLTFEPGTIKVVTRKSGKDVLTKEIHSAGMPYQIRLTPDRSIINNDGVDLSFVSVEVLDKNGNLCPNADNFIHFELSGNGKIAGVDNGNPVSLESFKSPQRKAFYGKCLVVIQSGKENETLRLKAFSDNLKSSEVSIMVNNM